LLPKKIENKKKTGNGGKKFPQGPTVWAQYANIYNI